MGVFKSALLTAALLAADTAYAQQGVVMVMNDTTGGQTTQSRLQMDRTHVRAEVREEGRQVAAVFDSGSKVLRIIDAKNRTYTEMTQQDMEQVGGMLAQVQEQMKNMPPEQRKMMEEMMKGRGGMPGASAPPAPITYKKTGTGKVGQWNCTTYDGFRGSDKVAEVCAAESVLTAADFQVVRELADFMKTLSPQIADQVAVYGTGDAQGFVGFPVRRVTFKNGVAESTSELAELRREAIAPDAFAPPAGFKKQSMGR